MRIWQGLVAVVAGVLLTGCVASSTQGGALGVNRGQLMLVSSAQMQAGADEAYAQVLGKAKEEGKLNQNKAQVERLRTIAKRLVAHVGVFRQDATQWAWEVNLITEDTLNAWCMPGGKIAFYTGILDQLKLDDHEVAAIMGHEMAHALREHSRERASQDQLRQIGLFAVQKATGASGEVMKLADMATHYTITLPYSREHERESDIIGLELAARAGYDPKGAVRVWEKMAKVSQSTPPEFLSTHPSPQSRIAELQQAAARVMPLYEKAPKP
ncbi:M48 family metallopeptidase [Sulfurospirillum sp. T05]|uniref:M48 family metallopeptidase n=1 Tax=Sulfurospirillum tamanense TaxID=2813362 RepID=A0ABS2WUF8_9BACT|nr:M48 family metallopeptidase [Sulfurospirillum tamanensis]MBN2965218.1 M48 family metallopeptidase [Sulfurospirillum tamanensis]